MINGALGEPWPDEVTRAVESFKQGHLLEQPPFFYAANLRYPVWELSRAAAEPALADEDAEALLELEPDQRPPYGIMTSQTCDIAEERPHPAQPWITIAPVYRCDRASGLLERDYVVALDPPDLDGEVWVADLRIEMSLEKGVLVGRAPIEAFRTEDAYDGFSDLLGRRRGRPALASIFHEVINVTTREMKNKSSARRNQARRVRQTVYKLKLAIEDGTRLRPVAAKLYIITRGPADDEARDWFDAWWNTARVVAERYGLQLLPNGWLDGSRLDAELYDQLVEIRNPLHH